MKVMHSSTKNTHLLNVVLTIFRGSHSTADWQDNMKVFMIGSSHKGKFHAGFFRRAKIFPVMKILNESEFSNRNLIFCGHSMGGAVAAIVTIFALIEMEKRQGFQDKRSIRCFTFGAPLIGDSSLQEVYIY